MKKETFIMFLAMMLLTGRAAVSQDAAADKVTSEDGVIVEDTITYSPDDPAFAEGAASANKFSITLDDVPLDDVVKMFTKIAPDANIIVSATNLFDKTVTVNLKEVEWKPALSSILNTHNLQLSEESAGVYTIIQKQEGQLVTMSTKPFKLNYMTCGDIAPVVKAMLPLDPPGSTLTQFQQRNMLIVRSTPDTLTSVEAIIKEIDQPSAQVSIETKFMELNDEASKQLGIKWTSLEEFGVKLGAGPFTRTEDVRVNDSRNDTVNKWDRRQKTDRDQQFFDQNGAVVIQQEYAELPPGIDSLSVLPDLLNVPTRTVDDNIDTGINRLSDTVENFSKAIVEQQAAIMDFDDLDLIISALKKTDGVSIISNPKIIVTSGYTNAVFRVGRKEPIIKTEIKRGTTDSPGDIVTASLDTEISTDSISGGYVHTGIELRVVPTVKTKNLIEAQIDPVLTRKLGDKTVGNNSWPIMSIKEISTKFTLMSGQTVAIGGLTDSMDTVRVSKIPLLGNIPLIGKYLFSHKADTTSQIETIIFVTLTLADPQDLNEYAGIPEDASLVHRKRMQQRAVRERNLQDLEIEREAVEAKMEQGALKLKSRLMKRDK